MSGPNRGSSKEHCSELPSCSNTPASKNWSMNEAAIPSLNFNSTVPSILHATGIEAHPIDCHSWPNVLEGRRLHLLRGFTDKSFAQKVQAWSPGNRKSELGKVAEMVSSGEPEITFQKNESVDVKIIKSQEVVVQNQEDDVTEAAQEVGAFHAKINNSEALVAETTLKKGRRHKKIRKQIKIPAQDSHVCVIDISKREEWMQVDPVKQPVPYKCPASFGEDFPDLTSALKVLSKCTVRHDFVKAAENGNKSSDALTQLSSWVDSNGRKFRKKQPRRRDPISVNILDIIREADSCVRISQKNLRKINSKDCERKTIGGNILDSANPVRKRGKHREAGHRKRLSKLKQIILSERIKKQEQRGDQVEEISLVPEDTSLKPSVDSICDGIVSLKIINNACTSCSYPEQLNSEHQFSEKDCPNTSLEISPATLNNVSVPILSVTVAEKLRLQNIPSSLHSRKFRDYCDNMRTKALDEAVKNLLKAIYGFQDRHFQKDPIRAHAKRRFVIGIREVKKFLMLKRLKFIVVAPDLEPVKSPGGLDETLIQIREEGRTQQIPVIFAAGRRQLGFTLMRKVPISIIGIISAEGAEELVREVMAQWHIAVDMYQQKGSELCFSSEK